MPEYLFTTQRVTNYEDIIMADTEEEAIALFDELITYDLTEVSQHITWEVVEESTCQTLMIDSE